MTWKELQLELVRKALDNSARAVLFIADASRTDEFSHYSRSEDAAYSTTKKAAHYALLALALQEAFEGGITEGFQPLHRVHGKPRPYPGWYRDAHWRIEHPIHTTEKKP